MNDSQKLEDNQIMKVLLFLYTLGNQLYSMYMFAGIIDR